jgi:hypothetical protein
MKKTKLFLTTIFSSSPCHCTSVIARIIFFLIVFLFPNSVSAQQMTMTAIPPKVELKGNPGQTLTATLKIRNDSENTEIFAVSAEDFIVIDSKGTPVPITTQISNRWSLATWISAPKEIPVDAGGVQILDISIKIPMTALSGGHYAMIVYTPNAQNKAGDLKQTGNIITQRIGTLIYVTVSGPVTEKATITKFSVPKFLEQGPVEFFGSIENMSDIHVNPKGTVTISNPFNIKVAEINVDTGNIFPESTRDFTTIWNQKWGWGRYKADLHLTYGTSNSLLSSTIFFWLFPIRLVIYGLVILISILTVIIILDKRSKKHQQDLEKEVQTLKDELQQIENK